MGSAATLAVVSLLAVPYKLSPHLANDIVKQMLKNMPGILQEQGMRVVGRMPGSVLPIVVDDASAADEEGEEPDATDDENAPVPERPPKGAPWANATMLSSAVET